MSHDGVVPERPPFKPPKVPTARLYDCVSCGKRRLTKYDEYEEDGTVIGWTASGETLEKELADGTKVEHPTWDDLCVRCQIKIYKKYYAPTKADADKVIKAIEGGYDLGDKSLEELL